MNRWKIWTALTGTAALAAAYSFVSFWATIDLGYDRSAQGQTIMAVWCYSALALMVSTIVLGVIATKSFIRRNKSTQ